MSLMPMADAVSDEKYKKEAMRIIAERQLVGAANNTKWNELISEVRDFSEKPCYRTKVVNGYISGWDNCCYPSPVDGHDYINVPAGLPSDNVARDRGWFDYVAVVHPVDKQALDQMVNQDYGNPFIHHLTLGIVPPKRIEESDFDYANQVIPFMVDVREKIENVIGDVPGTLIMALPEKVINHQDFAGIFETWVGDLSSGQYQIEVMSGGGFLIQFFVLTGGRVEVALRCGTTQTFNPKSVHKISRDEISTIQE